MKGVLNELFTLNHYGYCWNNSINLTDRNGNWPEWVQKAGQWCSDNRENLIKIGIGAACVAGGAVLVAATGGAALPVLLEGAVAMAEAGAIGAVTEVGIKTVGLAISGNLDSAHVGEIGQAAWDGFANGAMFGGILHGFGTAIKVGKGIFEAQKALKVKKTISPFELEPTHPQTKSNRQMRKLIEEIKADGGIKETIKYVEHNGKKYVVDGHHRLIAAKKLRLQEVPIEEVHLPYSGYSTIDDLLWCDE